MSWWKLLKELKHPDKKPWIRATPSWNVTSLQWNPGLTICQGSSIIISLNRKYRYTGVLPHTFYYNFCWVGKRLSIVIPEIVKLGFHCSTLKKFNFSFGYCQYLPQWLPETKAYWKPISPAFSLKFQSPLAWHCRFHREEHWHLNDFQEETHYNQTGNNVDEIHQLYGRLSGTTGSFLHF